MSTKRKTQAKSYLDEFLELNGRDGFEFLDDLVLTGDRTEDRAQIVNAIDTQVRSLGTKP